MDTLRANHWYIRFILMVFLLLPIGNLVAKNVIFDLGGVLLRTKKSCIMRKIGIFPLLSYSISHGNPRTALFKTLANIEPFMEHSIESYDEEENTLPPLFCDFLAGIPSEQILDRIAAAIDQEDLLWQLAETIFDPLMLASSQRIINAGESFVHECIEQGHDVYILSNWDAESFVILQQLYPAFFSLFKGIVVSGNCHLVKPDPAIYTYLLKTFQLDPHECVFIDNQYENIDAAEQVGMKALYCPTRWTGSPHFKKVRKQFYAWLEEEAKIATL
jgi:FMN phosphatase YigB (HAD superfamily)